MKTFINRNKLPHSYRPEPFNLKGYKLFFDYKTRQYVVYREITPQAAAYIRKQYGIAIIQENLSEFMIHVFTWFRKPTDWLKRKLQMLSIKGSTEEAMDEVMRRIEEPTETEKKLYETKKLMSEDMNKAADWFRKGGTMSISLDTRIPVERKHGKRKEKLIFVGARSGRVLKIIER